MSELVRVCQEVWQRKRVCPMSYYPPPMMRTGVLSSLWGGGFFALCGMHGIGRGVRVDTGRCAKASSSASRRQASLALWILEAMNPYYQGCSTSTGPYSVRQGSRRRRRVCPTLATPPREWIAPVGVIVGEG
ncbi:hypothetical protein FRB93_002259 [Tulasnella sp. JGI-2019a]|nr:hypothetical protein FRB93_002259 [Tulasnella sp. JGI-2019a]